MDGAHFGEETMRYQKLRIKHHIPPKAKSISTEELSTAPKNRLKSNISHAGEKLAMDPIFQTALSPNNIPSYIFSLESYWDELIQSCFSPAHLCLAIFPNNS